MFRFVLTFLICVSAISGVAPQIHAATSEACIEIPKVPTISLTGSKAVFWPNGSQLRVQFLNGNSELQNLALTAAQEWSRWANISFVRVDSGPSDIRVRFDDGTDNGNWSYLGTDANLRPNQHSMYLSNGVRDNNGNNTSFYGTVLHEFGHALGFVHEHMSPIGGIKWNKEKVYAYFSGPPNNWSRAQVDINLFDKLKSSETNFSAYDRYSIMHYAIDPAWTTDGYGVPLNRSLSANDRRFAGILYPKAESTKTEILDQKTYIVRSRFSGSCLDVIDHSRDNGAIIQQWSCSGEEQQMFKLQKTSGDNFRFQGVGSQKCLSAQGASRDNGAAVIQWDCHGGPDQDLRVIRNFDGSFSLAFAHSDKCLTNNDYSSFRAMTQENCQSDYLPQSWIIYEANPFSGVRTDQFYNLISRSARKCLDIRDHSRENGARLQQWECTGESHQLFAFTYAADGYYTMASPHSNRCVSSAAGGIDNGVPMIQWDCQGGADQLVRFEPADSGYYRIVFKNSNKCMDIQDQGDRDGQEVHQWDCSGGADQDWFLLVK